MTFNPTPARREREASPQPEGRVLRGAQAAASAAARLDGDLRSGRSRALLNDDAVEQARQSAAAQGYADGWAEGHRAATAQLRAEAAQHAATVTAAQQQHAAALLLGLQAVDAAASQLESRVAEPMAEVETVIAAAAVDLAEAVLGRELMLASDPGLDAVRRALKLAPANRPVIIRLNPAEADAVRETLASGAVDFALGREITVLSDPTVASAGCVVECDATRVDAQLGPALQRVWAVLAS